MNNEQENTQSHTQVLVNGWVRAGESEALAEYQQVAGPVLVKHGAEFQLKTKAVEVYAGSKPDFVLLINFPSLAAASAAFADPDYTAMIPKRDQALERVDIIALA